MQILSAHRDEAIKKANQVRKQEKKGKMSVGKKEIRHIKSSSNVNTTNTSVTGKHPKYVLGTNQSKKEKLSIKQPSSTV